MNSPPKRRWAWPAGLAILLVLAGGLGAAWWWRPRPAPVPPEVPLEGLDREVAQTIRQARAAVLADPHSGAAWGLLGRVLLANEMYPELSQVCFQEAERLDPDNPRWPYFCAFSLLNQGQREAALPELERAVALGEQTPRAPTAPRLQLAETLIALEQPEVAAEHFRQVLGTEPNNPRAHYGLGMLAYARGQWQECRTHLEQPSLGGSPQARKKAAALLATVCERLGDRAAAEKYAALAARLPKDFSWDDPLVAEHADLARRKRDRYRAAEQLQGEGRLEQAATVLAGLLREYPDDYLAQLTLGKVLAQMGRFEPAEGHLVRARELAPDKVEVHYLLGLTLFKKGELLYPVEGADHLRSRALFEESVTSTRKALVLKPDYGFAHMALGLALRYLGRGPEALEAFRQAVHFNPEYADNHLFLGEALADAGKEQEARAHFEEAQLLAGPNDPRPRADLERLSRKKARRSGN